MFMPVGHILTTCKSEEGYSKIVNMFEHEVK